MNRKSAILLLAIVETLIYISVIALFAYGKISILTTIIIFAVVAIVTMGLVAVIIRKFPPMDE